MKKIFLKPKKESAVKRFHPWVFSGAIARREGHPSDGEIVEVYSHHQEYLGTGHFQDGRISVRIFSFQPTEGDQQFWTGSLRRAYAYREATGLTNNPLTNCYRLVHGEGDGLPGLVVDIYNATAVLQCHSIGMHLERDKITVALQEIFGNRLEAVYDKSKEALPSNYAKGVENQYLLGSSRHKMAVENGHHFLVDWEEGQKTGFFLDQRENRRLLSRYAPGKSVLNAYCYSGGFSIYALKAGARKVHSVDLSANAIELTERNVGLNQIDASFHQSFTQDVLKFLRQEPLQYDLIVLDPPAFAKTLRKRHNAVQGYKRLNALALQKMQPGGILFTFSCSQVVGKELFYNTIVAAALEAGRTVKVMHQLNQPPDHPVSLYHPEGEYLKGLVLYVI